LIGTTEVPTPSPGTAAPISPANANRVVVELLRQPDLADAEFVRASGLGDHVVDDVGGIWLGRQNDSGWHVASNLLRLAAIPFNPGRSEQLPSPTQ
jgi:hypothetical protein